MKNKIKLTFLIYTVLFGLISCSSDNIEKKDVDKASNEVVSKIAVGGKTNNEGDKGTNEYGIELTVEEGKKGIGNNSKGEF